MSWFPILELKVHVTLAYGHKEYNTTPILLKHLHTEFQTVLTTYLRQEIYREKKSLTNGFHTPQDLLGYTYLVSTIQWIKLNFPE